MSSEQAMRRLRFSEALEPRIDDIIEIVQSGSDCDFYEISPETWLAVKAKILTVFVEAEEEDEGEGVA